MLKDRNHHRGRSRPEEIISDIADTLDKIAIARHHLHEEFVHGGWLDTGGYTEALKKLPDGLDIIRSRFGEEFYDRYLYATRTRFQTRFDRPGKVYCRRFAPQGEFIFRA